jgi:hypothetical protein
MSVAGRLGSDDHGRRGPVIGVKRPAVKTRPKRRDCRVGREFHPESHFPRSEISRDELLDRDLLDLKSPSLKHSAPGGARASAGCVAGDFSIGIASPVSVD